MQVVTQFLTLETLLDNNVEGDINLQIERGGIPLTVKLKVKLKYSFSFFSDCVHRTDSVGCSLNPLSEKIL